MATTIYEKLFESIDFSKYRVEAIIGDKLPFGYYKAHFLDFDVFVHEETGMFAVSNFIQKNTISSKRFSPIVLFKREIYADILKSNGFSPEDENCVRELVESGVHRFIFTSRLFWISLHWANRPRFIEVFFKELTGLELKDENINLEFIANLPIRDFNHSKFLGLPATVCEAENMKNWISLREFSLEIKDIYKEEIFKPISDRKDRATTGKLLKRANMMNLEQKLIQFGSHKVIFASPRSAIVILEDRGNNGNWIHLWDLVFKYSLDKKKVEIPKSQGINLNLNPNVEIISEKFAKTTHDGLEILFYRPLSYIHIQRVAKSLSKSKVQLGRWLKSESTMALIESIEKSLNLEHLECENQGTKFGTLKRNHLECENQSTKFGATISSSREGKIKAYIKITGDIKNNFRGYYFHPNLFLACVCWLDPSKFNEYLDFINNKIQIATFEGKTLKEYAEEDKKKLISYYESQLQAKENEIQAKKSEIKDLQVAVEYQANIIDKHEKRAISRSGSVMITRKENDPLANGETTIHLYSTNYVQTPRSKSNSKVIPVSDVRRTSEFIKLETRRSKSLTKYGNNKFSEKNYEEIEHLIELSDSIDDIQIDHFPDPSIDEDLENIKRIYNSSHSSSSRGKFFELQICKRFNLVQDKNKPTTFIKKFVLDSSDKGIDAYDFDGKIAYQMKSVKTINLNSQIHNFLNNLAKIKEIDRDWTGVLVVDSTILGERRRPLLDALKANNVKLIYEKGEY